MFAGPYEHHSNELPWRESIAGVVVIGEDADGHIDTGDLEAPLRRYPSRPLRIGSFSAASSVTGILTDTSRVASLLHAHGALSFWDYAAAGPYLPVRMAETVPGRGDHKDAVFLSPRKFPGGPQAPGVLVVRRDLVRNRVPTQPGGGTVAFVDPLGHRYSGDPVAREEGGTPAIVESIRAGLVFGLKDAVGTGLIQAREEFFWRRALDRWQRNPGIEILGNPRARRLAVVSFRIRAGRRCLHHNFVVVLLSDVFGIQARGGCSCAGPYGHRLLAIGAAQSHALRDETARGCEGIKPGWTRVSFGYFISPAAAGYITGAVDMIATGGYRLLTGYLFDPRTGLWRHRSGPAEPSLRLGDLRYAADGTLTYPTYPTYPRRHTRAGEDALAGYLAQACRLLAVTPDRLDDGPAGLPDDFEELRWFCLPPVCLDGAPSCPEGKPAARVTSAAGTNGMARGDRRPYPAVIRRCRMGDGRPITDRQGACGPA